MTTTPKTGNIPTPKTGTSPYIFIACLLEASQHGATLSRLIDQPGRHTDEVLYALWAARRALRHEELDFACRARKAGQLLFAWTGTTVLQGGAV